MAKRKLSDLGANFVEVPLSEDVAPPAAPPEPTISSRAAAGLGAADNLSFGLADIMHGGAKALENKLRGRERVELGPAFQPEPGDTPAIAAFKRKALAKQAAQPSDIELNRRAYEQLQQQAQLERPGAFMAGGIGSGLAVGLAGGAFTKVPGILKAAAPVLDAAGNAVKPSLLRMIAGGAAGGFAQGAASGAGHSQGLRSPEGVDVARLLTDMGVGGALGFGLGAAGPVAGKVAGKAIDATGRRMFGLGPAAAASELAQGAGPALARQAVPEMAQEAIAEAAPAALAPRAPSAGALPPVPPVPVAANIEEALARQAEAGGAPTRMPARAPAIPAATPAGEPGVGGAAGEAAPESWGEVFDALKGGAKDASILQRLAQAVTPQNMMAKAGRMAPGLALKALGGIKSDIAKNVPIELEEPVGLWALQHAVKTGADKKVGLNLLKDIAANVGIQKKLGAIAEPPNPADIEAAFVARLKEIGPEGRKDYGKQLEQWLPVLREKFAEGPVSIADLNASKAKINRPEIWKDPNLAAPDKLGRKDAVMILQKIIDSSAERNLPADALKDYRKAKLDYSMTQKLLPLAEGGVNRERGNMPISLPAISAGTGTGATIGGALGGLVAGPPGIAVGGLAGSSAGALAAEYMSRRGASVLAPFFHKLGQAAKAGEKPSAAARAATFRTLQDWLDTVDAELAQEAVKSQTP